MPLDATNKFVDWSFSVDGIVDVDENGMLNALMPGATLAIATSLNALKADTCFVEVIEAANYIIADFDQVIPVTNSPQPDRAQFFTVGGSSEIAYSNPRPGESNPSAFVVKYNRPSGTWKNLGMVMPTADIQSTDRYSQFQFKYMGKEIEEFYVQLKPVDGQDVLATVSVEGYDAWQLLTIDLDLSFELEQFNIFVNPDLDAELTCYFDDFVLSAYPAEWYSGTSISDANLDLSSGEEYVLAAEMDGNPFLWISEDNSVATVDQNGKVSAIALGTTKITAVPLYGDAVECLVKVDGGEVIFIPATAIAITGGSSLTLQKTDSYQLSAIITPSDATERDILWESSQDSIVSVSETGKITALAGGNTIITASIEANASLSTSIIVEVIVEVDGLFIEGESEQSVMKNSTLQLVAVISPADATEKAVDWFTEDSDIATISQGGLVTGIAKGSSLITARSVADPMLRASVSVIVGTLGVGLNEIHILTIYPNPVKDHFFIKTRIPIEGIELINITGEIVLQREVSGHLGLLLSELELDGGIYILRVKMEDGSILVGKIVVE